jgi:serine/threonine protein kinase
MKVTLHLQKQIYKLNIEPSSTLLEFRQLVQTQSGIPMSQQILEIDANDEIIPMKEGILEENGVEEGCNIFLSVSQEMLKTRGETTMSSVSTTKDFSITKEMFETWDCEELCTRLEEMGYSKETIEKCRENEVDGPSLLEFSFNELNQVIGIKPGPAKKMTILVKKIKNGETEGKKESKENTDSPSKKLVPQQDFDAIHREKRCIDFGTVQLGKEIGSGGESTIFLGTYFGEDYAVKRILKVKSKELDTIMMLDDPCLMKSHYWTQEGLYCYYLMEMMDTTLDEALYQKTIELSDRDKFKIIQDIVHGCRVLHSKKIVHKDLKPLNILLKRNKSGTILGKISDFGISRVKQTESDSSVTIGITGTIRYLPVEFLQNQVYGYFTDVYTFGVILFEILFEERPWKECKSNDEIIKLIGKGECVSSTNSCGKEWKEVEIIMKQCLGRAEERLSFEEIEKRMSQLDGSVFQSKVNKGSVSGITVAPKIEQDIWTYQRVMESFIVPKGLQEHIRRLFDNDPNFTALNLWGTSHLNSYSRQSNWR